MAQGEHNLRLVIAENKKKYMEEHKSLTSKMGDAAKNLISKKDQPPRSRSDEDKPFKTKAHKYAHVEYDVRYGPKYK